ncbi:ABC transporter permease [Conexibacter woesei]|uniref:Transport permease protein n=1 Tax=Conexibacter woesei (strain DSM 14684 / CCUG 47730 / CIP 108061 / JCM 11494 / NBRC 100937 / ID131577) TaxID=469383 RepID=D3F981_CONWI|nr:ABC transporter permease [Conexibacter woesei]ADB49048.1 ABC-2 type transporter [Conexibacter woesei DSM 14684]
MSALARITAVEWKLLLRDPISVGFAIGLPVALLLVFGLPAESREPSADLGGDRAIDTVLPSGAFVLSFGMLAFFTLPFNLASYRERGILRRLATTPVRPSLLLVAQLVVNVAVAAVAGVLVLAIGPLALDMALPANPVGLLLALVLGAASLFGVGLMLAALVPRTRRLQAIGPLIYFPSLFLAGLWLPKDDMPAILATVGDLTPLSAFRETLQDAWIGDALDPLLLLVMVVWALGSAFVAARTFRWE